MPERDISQMTAEQARQQLVTNYTVHLPSCVSRGGRPAPPGVVCNCGLWALLDRSGYDPVDFPTDGLDFTFVHPGVTR